MLDAGSTLVGFAAISIGLITSVMLTYLDDPASGRPTGVGILSPARLISKPGSMGGRHGGPNIRRSRRHDLAGRPVNSLARRQGPRSHPRPPLRQRRFRG